MSISRAGAWLSQSLLVTLGAVFLVMAWQLSAQPISGRIISNVEMNEIADGTSLHIEFTLPVRYKSHFPRDFGDTVQISLQAVAVSAVDQDFLQQRESFNLSNSAGIPLLDITYEGDLPGGPYLTIRFTEPVAFSVRQGDDFRSLIVNVFENNTASD